MKSTFNEVSINKYFKSIQKHLLNNKYIIPYQHSRNWCKDLPKDPGVYCFFIDGKLKYVGETGCLKKRLADLLDTRNHTLRRAVGEAYFSKNVNYTKATSSKKFHPKIEKLVERWISRHLKVSFLPISIGRKEFEEWLQLTNTDIIFFNKRKKRH